MRKLILASAALALGATPLSAQQAGLINIDLSNLLEVERNEIAKDINIDVSQIPVNVQVPVSVAAAICDLDVNVLAKTKTKGETACAPTAGSAALNQAILKQRKQQK